MKIPVEKHKTQNVRKFQQATSLIGHSYRQADRTGLRVECQAIGNSMLQVS